MVVEWKFGQADDEVPVLLASLVLQPTHRGLDVLGAGGERLTHDGDVPRVAAVERAQVGHAVVRSRSARLDQPRVRREWSPYGLLTQRGHDDTRTARVRLDSSSLTPRTSAASTLSSSEHGAVRMSAWEHPQLCAVHLPEDNPGTSQPPAPKARSVDLGISDSVNGVHHERSEPRGPRGRSCQPRNALLRAVLGPGRARPAVVPLPRGGAAARRQVPVPDRRCRAGAGPGSGRGTARPGVLPTIGTARRRTGIGHLPPLGGVQRRRHDELPLRERGRGDRRRLRPSPGRR